MAERDLLNKFLGSLSADVQASKAMGRPPPAPVNKLGVAQPAREVAREASATPAPPGVSRPGAAGAKTSAPAKAPPSAAPAQAEPANKAYKAAYFNRDVQATRDVNLRSGPLKALRGEEGATDLRRVVLPSPAHGEGPSEPEIIASALRAMASGGGGNGPSEPVMGDLLQRWTEWSGRPSIRKELIEARQRALEAMVAARRAALQRLRALQSRHGRSSMVDWALHAEAEGLPEGIDDLEAQADRLIEQAGEKAAPMRRRLAKVLGSKK